MCESGGRGGHVGIWWEGGPCGNLGGAGEGEPRCVATAIPRTSSVRITKWLCRVIDIRREDATVARITAGAPF